MIIENMTDEELMQLTSPPDQDTENVSEEVAVEEVVVEEVNTTVNEPTGEVEVKAEVENEPEEINVLEDIISGSKKESSKEDSIDYKTKYEELMSSFKANGKSIDLRSTDEARQLMQMGANFTKKMQEIAPYRKIIAMLQTNNLLDENKLSFLIDLDKKNLEAIQHLVKDSNLDPLDIDTSEESKYVPVNHSVSEKEIQFKEYLEELSNDTEGQNSVQLFNTWDTESKAKLWEHPELMKIIHVQRGNGTYDQICTEMDHLKLLGKIPENVSFIEAYTRIGNELQSRNQNPSNLPVAKKTVTPKSQVMNNQAARAASTPRVTRTTSNDVSRLVNMSDEDFMKQITQYRNRM